MKNKEKYYRTKVVSCSTAEELLGLISPRSKHWKEIEEPYSVLFRGHADERFKLVPTALRMWGKREGKPAVTNYSQVRNEVKLLRNFYWLADRCGLPLPEDSQQLRGTIFSRDNRDNLYDWDDQEGNINWPPREVWSLLALAQHHGLPTRLLDWSLDARRAAYFPAVEAAGWAAGREKRPRGVKNISIWALSRRHKYATFGDRISVITAPSAGNKNLHAQKGVFTLYRPLKMMPGEPIDARPLDVMIEEENISVTLTRFLLPVAHARRLLRLLAFEGASGADLFPGYDGIIKGLKEKRLWDRYVW